MTPSPLAFGGRHPNPRNKRAAAVIGVGHTDWVRDWQRCRAGEQPNDTNGYGLEAFLTRWRSHQPQRDRRADRRSHHRL